MTQEQFQTRVWKGPFTKALILENPHTTLDTYLRDNGIEPDRRSSPPKDEDELIAWLQEGKHNLIFKRSRVPITRRVIEAAPSLMGVQLCCIGDDSVDKVACAQHGVMVMNDPISNGRSVAELVLGEMICMSRRVLEASDATAQNKWTKSNRARYEILGKTLGVIGLGNIGKQVAQLASAMGMNVVFYDNREVAQEVGETLGWVSVDGVKEVFQRAHVVTVHVSATDFRGRSNENFIDAEAFQAFGELLDVPGPRLFINAARGFIYKPEDLIAGVTSGAINYAFVDVFPEEPGKAGEAWSNPYADVPHIYSTPHIGASTQEAQPRIARRVSKTVRSFNLYGSLRDCVLFPKMQINVPLDQNPVALLSVVHSDTRGTKKAVAETIYEAGLSNLSSIHRDMPAYGIAYDLNALDGMLDDAQIQDLIDRAQSNCGESSIRSVRVIPVVQS